MYEVPCIESLLNNVGANQRVSLCRMHYYDTSMENSVCGLI